MLILMMILFPMITNSMSVLMPLLHSQLHQVLMVTILTQEIAD